VKCDKTLTRTEALKAMIDGEKIKWVNSDNKNYIFWNFAKKEFSHFTIHPELIEKADQCLHRNTGYVIYKEPKKKVKVKFWQFVNHNGAFMSLMFTEDMKYYWDGDFKRKTIKAVGKYTKTNCFIEVGIEE